MAGQQNESSDKGRKLEEMRSDITKGLPREVQTAQALKTFINE